MAADCPRCDCDVVIIGAGPAGLSTAVYAGAEECSVRLLDAGETPGGQAGQSTQIRNFFGFPDGISGPELAALGVDSALSFGVDLRAPITVHRIEKDSAGRFLLSTDDEDFTARAVVIATGSTPRRHRAPGVAAYHGRGVHYRGPHSENGDGFYQGTCFIVGGGNSAGQAATYLARQGCDVHVLVRGDSLAASMSRYLVTEMDKHENVTIWYNAPLTEVYGDSRRRLAAIRIGDDTQTRAADHLFLMLGSTPNTAWLRGTVDLDEKGFILTGTAVFGERERPLTHIPMPHETSVPGIFAAGDVRAGSLKRVAAAVGEGAGAYFDVHRYIN